jgi:hypothetical protein
MTDRPPLSDLRPDESTEECGQAHSPGGDPSEAGVKESSGPALSRRTVLKTGATIGAAVGLAGCSSIGSVTSYRFNAMPATLDAEQNDPAYSLARLSEKTVERTPTVMGREIDVELTNQFALYTGTHDSLGLLSSPTATIATQPQNPLATESLRDILVGNTGDRIMQALDLTDQSSVQWTQGPTNVDTATGQLLGQSTEIKAFAGITQSFDFVLITAARVTDGDDVVIVATVQQRNGQASTLVGQNGYVTRQTVTDSVQRVKTVLPRVERGGAGLELKESTRITAEGDEPNYIRVLASNQYDNRTLFSVSMTAQVFDDQGDFLEHRQGTISRLGPDEQFECYLPYTTDSVAGYGVEGEHSGRELSTESADSVDVIDDSLDDDTVMVRLRNTLSQVVPFVSLEVSFHDDDGNIIGVSQRTVADLDPGERRTLDVVYTPPAFESPAVIEGYSVDVLEYAGTLRYVR